MSRRRASGEVGNAAQNCCCGYRCQAVRDLCVSGRRIAARHIRIAVVVAAAIMLWMPEQKAKEWCELAKHFTRDK
jgi:hypothetical protein